MSKTILTHTASTSPGTAGAPVCLADASNYFVGIRKWFVFYLS